MYYPGELRADTFSIKLDLIVYGGFSGKGDQRDWLANPTILSGDIGANDTNTDGNYIAETPGDIVGNNAYHVVTYNQWSNRATRLNGFVITAEHSTTRVSRVAYLRRLCHCEGGFYPWQSLCIVVGLMTPPHTATAGLPSPTFVTARAHCARGSLF